MRSYLVIGLLLAALLVACSMQNSPPPQVPAAQIPPPTPVPTTGNSVENQQQASNTTQEPAAPQPPAQSPATPSQPAQTAPASTVEINMTAKQFTFAPDTITVHKGDRVIIHLTSADVTHGFGIQGYNAQAEITPGQISTVDFIADKTGTFTFYCTIVCGAGHSDMKGQLIVQ